jgi:hypothetical protein
LLAEEQLVSLTSSVLFSDSLLGMPLSISPGDIVPNAADFLDVGLPGQADGSFLTFSTEPVDFIATNGVFYSFEVQAQAAGSGVFAFDPLALIGEQYDPQDPFLAILRDVQAGADLPFQISGGGPAPIPAPSAFGMVLLGVACLRRRRSIASGQ